MGIEQKETRMVQEEGTSLLGQKGLERDDDSVIFPGDFMYADSLGVSHRNKGSWRNILSQPTQGADGI